MPSPTTAKPAQEQPPPPTSPPPPHNTHTHKHPPVLVPDALQEGGQHPRQQRIHGVGGVGEAVAHRGHRRGARLGCRGESVCVCGGGGGGGGRYVSVFIIRQGTSIRSLHKRPPLLPLLIARLLPVVAAAATTPGIAQHAAPTRGRRQLLPQRGQHQPAVEQRQGAEALGHHRAALLLALPRRAQQQRQHLALLALAHGGGVGGAHRDGCDDLVQGLGGGGERGVCVCVRGA
jgi:hypothetical protein